MDFCNHRDSHHSGRRTRLYSAAHYAWTAIVGKVARISARHIALTPCSRSNDKVEILRSELLSRDVADGDGIVWIKRYHGIRADLVHISLNCSKA